MSSSSEIDINKQRYIVNESPAQNNQVQTNTNQNTTQYDETLEQKVENEEICIVDHENDIPKDMEPDKKILTKEHNTTNKTVKINIEDDEETVMNPAEKELQNKNIGADVSDKNKPGPITVRKQLEEWVFMYQQPYPPPQYPPPQYPPQQYPPPQYPPPQYPPPQYPPPQYPPPGYGQPYGNQQRDSDVSYEDNGGSRSVFVRNVFAIVAVMLAFTVAFITVCYITEDVKVFLSESLISLALFIVAFIGYIAVAYTYCLLGDCARKVPINFILNTVATICFSYIGAYMAVKYAPIVVIGAAATTLAVTLFCLGLAFTSFDFTKFMLLVMVGMFACFFSAILVSVMTMALGVEMTLARIVLLVISSVLCSVMLVIEFQMILGGKSVELGENEYTYAAFLVYESIIFLFIKCLGLGGAASGEGD